MHMRSLWCCLVLLAPVALADCGDSTESANDNAGGSAGASGNAGPLFPIDPSAAARAAVLIGSCIPDDRPNGHLSGFYTDFEPSDSYNLAASIQCLSAKTNGCEGVKECLGVQVTLDGPCVDTCAGNVAIACDDEVKFTIDCSRIGLTCHGGDCIGGPPKACDEATFQETCVGGAPHTCTSRERIGPKCADLGLVCETGTMGPACVGTGPACQSNGTSPLSPSFDEGLACDGSTLSACLNGKTATRECAGVGQGFGCHSSGSAFFCGLGAECNPLESKWTETCDGDSVVLCNAGKVEKIDCKSLGFAGCLAGKGVCVPSPWQP